jgi:hypothetical protein
MKSNSKLPEVIVNFCVPCFRSTTHTGKIDKYGWLILKCSCCKEENHIEIPDIRKHG